MAAEGDPWADFPFRDGDIVISAPSKSGTTWMQMICALLVFRTPELPRPLAELSPWVDEPGVSREELFAALAGQRHRRFIKSHLPLARVPLDPAVNYVVVARHPLDRAVSMYHQMENVHRAVADADGPKRELPPLPPLAEWLLTWCHPEQQAAGWPDDLMFNVWHIHDAWTRRNEPNILLVHYDDLLADLAAEMRGVADWLDIDVPDDVWPELARAATFAQMKDRADRLAPVVPGFPDDPSAFFHGGRSGAASELLTDDDLAAYRARLNDSGPEDFLDWLHHDRVSHGAR